MTHWNPEHVPANAIFSSYRAMAPASQITARLPPMGEEKVHNIVYYTRDTARSLTQFYPPSLGALSSRHPLTKAYPLNAPAAAPKHLNKQGRGSELGKMLSVLGK